MTVEIVENGSLAVDVFKGCGAHIILVRLGTGLFPEKNY